MKLKLALSAIAFAGIFASQTVDAHRLWVKPSATVVSGEDQWITFDSAVANTIFFPDHFPLKTDNFKAMSPSGKLVPLENQATLAQRAVFDLQLKEQGTYNVFMASRSIVAFWKDAEGKRKMWPGRGKTGTLEEFYQQVPQDANELNVVDAARRVEVFVTAGAPTLDAIKPKGEGIELAAITHPNDLYTNEPLRFALLLDGEAAAGASVTVVKGGEQYRDEKTDISLTANEKGEFSFTAKEPGMYWVEAEYSDDKAKAPAKERRATYVTVLEVLPM